MIICLFVVCACCSLVDGVERKRTQLENACRACLDLAVPGLNAALECAEFYLEACEGLAKQQLEEAHRLGLPTIDPDGGFDAWDMVLESTSLS
mgnify:FL=1